ncbi:MAG: queuosine precursor transporter [Alphaproteobacteria bacterium]|nr:queuosine precursor transporter [Alphaproteobacteria bacterium]
MVLFWAMLSIWAFFLYPLTFTLCDLVHRELGRELTRKCIYFAVLINLLMSAYFAFIALFPSDPASPASLAFNECLAPVWRIIVFSLLAQLISELVDTEVYHVYEKRFGEKHNGAASFPAIRSAFQWGDRLADFRVQSYR